MAVPPVLAELIARVLENAMRVTAAPEPGIVFLGTSPQKLTALAPLQEFDVAVAKNVT